MKTQKRSILDRAYTHGYKAAISGRSIDICPHNNESTRFQWTSGWREGRQNFHQGLTGVAGIQSSALH